MDDCPVHILESTKGIEMKLGLQIDGSERKGSAQEPQPCPVSPHNHFFLLIMVAYPGHILESTKGIKIKLGTCTYIDVNERKVITEDKNHNPVLHFT